MTQIQKLSPEGRLLYAIMVEQPVRDYIMAIKAINAGRTHCDDCDAQDLLLDAIDTLQETASGRRALAKCKTEYPLLLKAGAVMA